MNHNEITNNIFEDIKDYEGFYKISKNGDIWSCWYEKIMSPQLCKDGYYKICLIKKGLHKRCSIHRLLALQYIPNLENKEQVDHIDRNTLNNSLSNLRWVTRIENCQNKNNNLSLLDDNQLEKRKEDKKKYHAEWFKKNYPLKQIELGITPRSEMTKTKQPDYRKKMDKKIRETRTPEQKQLRLEKSREYYKNGGLERQRLYLQNKKLTEINNAVDL
jgi:hypothetical protein